MGNHSLFHRTVPFIMLPFYVFFYPQPQREGGKEESIMRLGTHMQVMDIGSLRIKNVLNNLGAGEKTRQQPPHKMQSLRQINNQPYFSY